MEIAALVILILFSLVGFAAIFFTTFGTLIIFIGAIVYSIIMGFSVISLKTLLALSALYFLGESLEYVFIIIGAKKFGASNMAVFGAIIGGIAGAVIGVGFLGIGVVLGTFLGIFFGAFIVEFIIQRDLVRSLQAGTGSVLGRAGSIFAKVIIAIVMFAIMAGSIIKSL
jgi:uncharacterized protein YqgC (DUF456 family)